MQEKEREKKKGVEEEMREKEKERKREKKRKWVRGAIEIDWKQKGRDNQKEIKRGSISEGQKVCKGDEEEYIPLWKCIYFLIKKHIPHKILCLKA